MAEHETKFSFPAYRADNIIKWLRCRCKDDGEFPQGIISSVYYDTIDWNFLQEKLNSDFLKTKYRLRWYQNIDSLEYSPEAYFEKKNKIGHSRQKKRIVFPMNEAIKNSSYLNGEFFTQLPLQLCSTEIVPTRSILPVFEIRYHRYRFVDTFSDARLAVDYGIHIPRINPFMMKKHRKDPLSMGVFEYKSSHQNLPDWLHGVSFFGCKKDSFSKYSNCYEHSIGMPI